MIKIDIWFNLINIEIYENFRNLFWFTDFIYVPKEFLSYTYFKNWMIRCSAEKKKNTCMNFFYIYSYGSFWHCL